MMAELKDVPHLPDLALATLAGHLKSLRPPANLPISEHREFVNHAFRALAQDGQACKAVARALRELLDIEGRQREIAEIGIRSALGFTLEVGMRVGERLLPVPLDPNSLLGRLNWLLEPQDALWLAQVDDASWQQLAEALKPWMQDWDRGPLLRTLVEATRLLSYRLAGAAIDRELLRADQRLEQYTSPFLALNALLLPWLERIRTSGELLSRDESREAEVLLEQCRDALKRVARRTREIGTSIRLTYQLARMEQLLRRLELVLPLLSIEASAAQAIALLRDMIASERRFRRLSTFLGENVSLLARSVTDHAARHGEHYIAESRREWWAMGRAAAGGGVVIAVMALFKIQLALLHLPPLTEGLLFGLNYGLGFVLIHMLGFVVATKQPAMTAATIANTLEEAHPKRLDRLAELAQNTIRTQFIAVLGNVGLAFPVACLLAWAWLSLVGQPVAPESKLVHMLHELHPLASGALFFAAVAGVGLFLSGLVSGYFDNQARYLGLGERVSRSKRFAWLGAARARALGHYVDEHYGAILGNLFFGFYLGLMGSLGTLTGIPIDIRHVAFASANVGTSLTTLGWPTVAELLPWAVLGVVGIAIVNLIVSFTLAIYVAARSKRLGSAQVLALGRLLLMRFIRNPFSFMRSP